MPVGLRVEWDSDGLVTALGQLPFFIDYLKQAGLFAGWVADCPLTFQLVRTHPASATCWGRCCCAVLSGHYRYAHITTLRCDAVNPRLLGAKKFGERGRGAAGLSEDRRGGGPNVAARRISTIAVRPLLSEPWVLDVDTTIKPLYGRQGRRAVVGYNPHKPGRPSHCYHTYMLSNLRLVLSVDVQPGDQHTPKHDQAGLVIVASAGAQPVAGSVARGCGMGAERAGDGACRAGGLAYPVSPADDSKRQAGTDQDDGRSQTGRRRGMALAGARRPHCGWWARAGNAASVLLRRKHRSAAGDPRAHPAGATTARLCRGRV